MSPHLLLKDSASTPCSVRLVCYRLVIHLTIDCHSKCYKNENEIFIIHGTKDLCDNFDTELVFGLSKRSIT